MDFSAVGQQEHSSPETGFLHEANYPEILEKLTGRDSWSPMGALITDDDMDYLSFKHRDGDLCCDVYARIAISRNRKTICISLED